MTKQRKAVALISGGLDSMLAARTIMDQGIHVEGINFFTGFCVEGHTHAIKARDKAKPKPKRNNALWVAEQLGIKLHIVDVIDEYKQVLINPKYGYGANLNPCLDCKIFMVRKAKQWLIEHDFDFVITGEVIGQRPMSQRKDTLSIVAKAVDDDRLLRPLCAKNLPPTLPEREAWVDRDRLHDFSGRSRKPQMALAESYGYSEYAQPAGGCCFLTDASYSAKLVDLWQAREGDKEYDLDDVMLLKVGRHIRPRKNFKLIVSREEGEGRFMQGYKKQFISLFSSSHAGPLVLVDGSPTEEDLYLAAQITARYGQGRVEQQVEMIIEMPDGNKQVLSVKPLSAEEIPISWYV